MAMIVRMGMVMVMRMVVMMMVVVMGHGARTIQDDVDPGL